MTAAGVVVEADAVAQLRDGLSRALVANERLAALAEELTGENTWLRERLAQRDAELEQMAAELAVLKRMVFGRSSEKGREPAGQGDGGQGGAGPGRRGRRGAGRRGRRGAHDGCLHAGAHAGILAACRSLGASPRILTSATVSRLSVASGIRLRTSSSCCPRE
ncbi:MAG: hypothetical protein ACT4NY_27755 [Pseudonocardiales bacterium]